MTGKSSKEIFEQAKSFVDQGDVDNLRQLIKKHPALCTSSSNDDPPPTPENALLLHVTNWPGGTLNGAAIAKLLIDSGADPMLRFKGKGETVLHWSASNDKDAEIIKVLLDSGAEIDSLGGVICGGTPLMNALYFGFTKIGALLVSRDAWIDNIIIAAGLGKIDLIESWHRGSGQYLKDSTRISPQSPSDGDELLSERATQTWTYRAVISALMCHQYHVVDWFIEHDFDINLIPDEAGWSCLHHAAYSGSLPMAMYLVTKGADLHVREENKATPADYGGAHGHPEVMNYLIDMGTTTSLEAAAGKGRLDIVMQGYAQCDDRARLLMRTIGNTTDIGKPIHPSIKRGQMAVARYLLQKEPGLHHQLVDGKPVISIAEEKDDQDWLSFIREY